MANKQTIQFIKVKINNLDCFVPKGLTILQACEFLGIEIPRFCYHKELLIAGNCRMCLVELHKSPKPQASCAMEILPNMVVYTNSPLVRKARENVLEFLLLNHPLDCPICDQGGECDLQDQSMLFGSDKSRFYKYKRSVEDKNCGPLIKTIMTRCIHCTRCVRFLQNVSGTPLLGTTNRGTNTEIGTYIKKNIKFELSGNLIDLCPVGALTSKPYAYQGRSWELKKKYGIDLFDGLGSNTLINIRGNKIMRILPRYNYDINNEWISDKGRYFFDGVDVNRIVNFEFSKKTGITLKKKNWFYFLKQYVDLLDKNPDSTLTVVGKHVSGETIHIHKEFLRQEYGHSYKFMHETNIQSLNSNFLTPYYFKDKLNDFSNFDMCLLINTNLRVENPILNSHLRKRYLQGNFKVYHLGVNYENNFPITHIGFSIKILLQILEGRHPICSALLQSKNPLIIGNNDMFCQKNHKLNLFLLTILKQKLQKFFKNWDSLNNLHNYANSMMNFNLGLNKKVNLKKETTLFLLETDNINIKMLEKTLNTTFKLVVYIGAHGTTSAYQADVVIPVNSITEESGTYVNTENRVQIHEKVLQNEYKNVRSLWACTNVYMRQSRFITNFMFYKTRKELVQSFYKKYGLTRNYKYNSSIFDRKSFFTAKYNPKAINNLFYQQIENFYLNDPITKNSVVMGQSSLNLRNKKNFLN